MAKYVELTSENFEATVAEGVTMVDFWAPWCDYRKSEHR